MKSGGLEHVEDDGGPEEEGGEAVEEEAAVDEAEVLLDPPDPAQPPDGGEVDGEAGVQQPLHGAQEPGLHIHMSAVYPPWDSPW